MQCAQLPALRALAHEISRPPLRPRRSDHVHPVSPAHTETPTLSHSHVRRSAQLARVHSQSHTDRGAAITASNSHAVSHYLIEHRSTDILTYLVLVLTVRDSYRHKACSMRPSCGHQMGPAMAAYITPQLSLSRARASTRREQPLARAPRRAAHLLFSAEPLRAFFTHAHILCFGGSLLASASVPRDGLGVAPVFTCPR